MNKLKSFFSAHSITAHSIAAGIAALVGAFYQVQAFHDLVLKVYGKFPASAKEIVVTVIALVGFYFKTNSQETQSK